jgi:serine/threonine protein kinase
MYHTIINCEPDYNHPNMSMAAKDIIRRLLNKDPNQRLKVSQARAHSFFKVIDFNCLLKKEVAPPFMPVEW